MRPSERAPNQLRPIQFTRRYTKYAEGSVLTCFGDTQVLCTASISDGVPRFLRDKKQGWLTAEYAMLPRATQERNQREAARGKQGGRTMEIQRLIARSLRAIIDLKALNEITITLDCDVIQADGGTRTAAISGACVALHDAIRHYWQTHHLKTPSPLRGFVGAVSVGICNRFPVLDLEYEEDCEAQTDMNIVMNDQGEFIEIQGTAEEISFSQTQLQDMLALANEGIQQIIALQKATLSQ